MLLDTHFHYDFLPPQQRQAFWAALGAQNIQLVAQTILPSAYRQLKAEEAGQDSACRPLLSLGFHPWWMTSEQQVAAELEIFEAELKGTRFIGEIGLDFLPRRLETSPAGLQLEALRALLQAVQQATGTRQDQGPYLLSIHSVRAVSALLELLEELALPNSPIVPVFHRFGGSSQELTRLIRLGGYLSVHPQMLETKRGRAYIRQLPADRLLLETDLPPSPSPDFSVQELADQVAGCLEQLLAGISAERGQDFRPQLAENQGRLYV